MNLNITADALVSLSSVFVVGLYVWSTKTHFRSDSQPPGLSLVAAAVFLCFAIFNALLWKYVQPLPVQLLGLSLIWASIALFWWAIHASSDAGLTHIFDKTKPRSLLTSGPFAHVRHPFYTSYIIFWAGFGIATGSVWAIIPFVIIVVIYTRASRLEEEKFFNSPLADNYREYMTRAGRFWPKFG